MSGNTKIEWTATYNPDGTVTPGKVWNPVVGCTKVSQGCKNCYAEVLHNRRHEAWLAGKNVPEQYDTVFQVVQKLEKRLNDPLHWKKPCRVFVNSVSDLFHPGVPDDFIDKVFAVMGLCPQHTFMILTKRPERMLRWFRDIGGTVRSDWVRSAAARLINKHRFSFPDFPLPNVWLGVSVENQAAANERIPLLLKTPAAVRFVSCEPLLGPVNITMWTEKCPECGESPKIDSRWRFEGQNWAHHHGYPIGHIPTIKMDGLDWVICGGESGANARPMHPAWARSLRDQCRVAGVPFFFEQWGEWQLVKDAELPHDPDRIWARVGKRATGRLLDEREWNEFPGGEV